MSSLKDKLAKHKAQKSSYGAQSKVGNMADLLGADENSDSSILTHQQKKALLQPAPLINIDLIDPDPNQPRKYFDPKKLEELSESIKSRGKTGKIGVKTPISVRENAKIPGRFIINHGERRWRASKIADQKAIPAFIDEDHTDDDAIIENVQRDDLTPREIADYLGLQLAKGRKKVEIAKAIGKSNAYITQHSALLDLPEPIAEAFNEGRCQDITAINDLVKAYKKNSDEVEGWLSDKHQEITRSSVDILREFLKNKSETKTNSVNSSEKSLAAGESTAKEVLCESKPSQHIDKKENSSNRF